MQHIRGRFRSIRADKFALVLFAIVLLGAALSWAMVAVAAGVDGANHVLASTGLSWAGYGLGGIALLWIVLRGIDFLRGGPTRAMFATREKHNDAQRTLSSNDLAHHF